MRDREIERGREGEEILELVFSTFDLNFAINQFVNVESDLGVGDIHQYKAWMNVSDFQRFM